MRVAFLAASLRAGVDSGSGVPARVRPAPAARQPAPAAPRSNRWIAIDLSSYIDVIARVQRSVRILELHLHVSERGRVALRNHGTAGDTDFAPPLRQQARDRPQHHGFFAAGSFHKAVRLPGADAKRDAIDGTRLPCTRAERHVQIACPDRRIIHRARPDRVPTPRVPPAARRRCRASHAPARKRLPARHRRFGAACAARIWRFSTSSNARFIGCSDRACRVGRRRTG